MFGALVIKEVTGRVVLDSCASPAVEAEVVLQNGAHGRASVSLKNAGQARKETAVIRELLSDAILSEDASEQKYIDSLLLQAVKKKQWNKNNSMGVLVLSMAAARAAGAGMGLPLYRYLGGTSAPVMPVPMMNMIRGGDSSGIDFREIMVVPKSAVSYKEGLRLGVEIYQTLKRLLSIRDYQPSTGEDGGIVCDIKNSQIALKYLTASMKLCGCRPGEDAMIAVNAQASQGSLDDYLRLLEEYPICAIINGLGKEDIEGRNQLKEMLNNRVLMAFDDFYSGNGIVMKMEKTGTVTKTLEMVKKARSFGYKVIISNNIGETEEPFIADLAAAVGADYIKSGAPTRGECTAKYNELIRIEEFYKKRYCICE